MLNKFNNKRKNAFTAIEMLVTVAVFTLLFFGVYQLQSNTLATFNVGFWKTESQRKLITGLKRIRDAIEKATYPSVIFENGSMIYGNTKPTSFTFQAPSNDLNNGGITGLENFYLRYKNCPNDTPLKNPTNGPIISFYICTPEFVGQTIMPKSDVATFANQGSKTQIQIIWRGPTNDKPYPAIQYQEGNAQPYDIIDHVSEVLITAKDIAPPGQLGKHYSIYNVHAIITIRVLLDSATDSRIRRSAGHKTSVKIVDEIKAKCNVRAVGNL